MPSPNLPYAAKRAYASGAHAVGSGLRRVGLMGAEVPDRDRRLRHWLRSLTDVHDSLAIAKLGVPWWTYRAIDIVDAWLVARPRPIRIFEYGSGASTIWLADRADEVVSVEHHLGFAALMESALQGLDNVQLLTVPPVESESPVVPSAKSGNAGLDFAGYTQAIGRVPGEFDLIVIDGRAREECLRVAAGRLKPDGIVVFDNSHRHRYRPAIAASPFRERRLPGLTPTLPYPDQTSLLYAPR